MYLSFEAVQLCCDHSARPWNYLNQVSNTVLSCCEKCSFQRNLYNASCPVRQSAMEDLKCLNETKSASLNEKIIHTTVIIPFDTQS